MTALFSPCGLFRYRLERPLFKDGEGVIAIIMVNPSVADASKNDPTITRIERRFMQHAYVGKMLPRPQKVIVGNLFARVATDVKELATVPDPVGPENDNHLWSIAMDADRLIYAWGPLAKLPKRLRTRWQGVHALFMASGKHIPSTIGPPADDGQPKHPLMLPYEMGLQSWIVPGN